MLNLLAAALLISLSSMSAQAAESPAGLENLGAPPPGQAWAELQASGSIAAVQLAGTVCPPTLVLGGQPVKLAQTTDAATEPKTAPSDNAGPALWVGGVKREASGKSGRFFIQLSSEESAVDSLEVVLRCGAGPGASAYRAAVPLGRIFLDGPVHAAKTVAAGEKDPRTYKIEFSIPGTIPRGARLTLEDGSSFTEGEAKITVSLPPGPSLIAGKLQRPDGTSRNLSVPVNVTVTEYDPLKPVLSVEAPANWVFAQAGSVLHGITNPGASLWLDGKPVEVGKDGRFEASVAPPAAEWKMEFKVSLQGGAGTTVFNHPALCPEFKAPQAGGPAEEGERLSLGRLRSGVVFFAQGAGGSSTTGSAQWAPRLRLVAGLSLQGYAGASFPDKQGGGIATLLEYGARLSLDHFPGLHDLSVELGGGGQTWVSFGGTFEQAGLFAVWNLRQPLLRGWLDRFYLGDEVAFPPGDMVHQIELGAGFRFF